MFRHHRIVLALSAAALIVPALGTRPAYADGAASTRNIIFGTAAAAAGALLIINHNKKVHERYAEDARRQAAVEEQRNDAQAAYESEKRAYQNEVALVTSYQHQVAVQHGEVVRQRSQIAGLQHQVAMEHAAAQTAMRNAASQTAMLQQQQQQQQQQAQAQPQKPAVITAAARPSIDAPTVVSYGWGTL